MSNKRLNRRPRSPIDQALDPFPIWDTPDYAIRPKKDYIATAVWWLAILTSASIMLCGLALLFNLLFDWIGKLINSFGHG